MRDNTSKKGEKRYWAEANCSHRKKKSEYVREPADMSVQEQEKVPELRMEQVCWQDL